MDHPAARHCHLLRTAAVAVFCLFSAAAHEAAALDILRLDKSVDVTEASIASRQIIKFRIRYNCASTSDSAVGALITDALDSNLDLVSLQGSAHTTDSNFDSGSRTVRFTFITPLPAGSTGEVFIQARFKDTAPDQTVASNQAVFSADNSVPHISNQVLIKAIDPPAGSSGDPPPPTFLPGLYGKKYGPGSITPVGPYLYYEVAHGNTGGALEPLVGYAIEDPLPAGTSLAYFSTDQWAGTSQPVTVYYKTNLSSAWVQWGAGARYSTADATKWIYPDELGLPVTEWVTALRLEYGTLPSGGIFFPGNEETNIGIVALMRDPASFSAGTAIRNCATISALGYTQTSCVDTLVAASQPVPYFYTGSGGGPRGEVYGIGEVFQIQTHIGVAPSSSSNMSDPIVWVLLPPELEYAGTWRTRWWATGASNAVPKFSRVDNGDGSTLLAWSWTGAASLTIPANRTWNENMVEADVKVRSRTPNGNYPATSYASWKTPAMDTGNQAYTADSRDVDQDGNITERLATHSYNVAVETGNGVSGLESVMYVRGELDSAWTKFPSVGQTVTGGKADYELHVRNIGGVVMRNTLIVDILPLTGDTGVIDLSPRGSQWSPFLVGAVEAPAGVTVYYSASRNPCRPELVPSGPPGCEDAQWTSTVPDDITIVRSLKFDLTGLDIFPGDELVLTWPMRAPWGAPTNGEVAWNSFGFVSTRADNGDSLLASEPVKTGISIQKPAPPYYGDQVWLDTDKDGIQDLNESGINGVRVDLYRDNGDGVADPASDTFVTFTATYRENGADGKYLFGNIGPGSYFAVILAPPETGVTTQDRTIDSADSDGTSIVYKNRRAAIMPVTKLDPLEEDRAWDQGFYTRSGIPAVWAAAQSADGRMVLGGKFVKSHGVARKNIVRVNADGSVDTSFNPGAGFDNAVRSIAIRADGRIWVGGQFTSYDGQSSRGVALLNSIGKADTKPAKPDTTDVQWVGTYGNIMYLAGAFGKVGGVPCGNVARLNPDGTVDTSFNHGAGANGTVYGGAVLNDGSVILVGAFSSFNGTPRKRVVKLKPDGTVDGSFDPKTSASGEIYSIKMIEDGRMTLTGNFRSFAGTPCTGAIRLDKTGKVDTTMQPSALNVDSINTSH